MKKIYFFYRLIKRFHQNESQCDRTEGVVLISWCHEEWMAAEVRSTSTARLICNGRKEGVGGRHPFHSLVSFMVDLALQISLVLVIYSNMYHLASTSHIGVVKFILLYRSLLYSQQDWKCTNSWLVKLYLCLYIDIQIHRERSCKNIFTHFIYPKKLMYVQLNYTGPCPLLKN